MTRVAILFDHSIRPETTGVYCHRALQELVGSDRIAQVEHYLPTDLPRLWQERSRWDLVVCVDDGLDYRLPDGLPPVAWWAIDTHLDFERCLRRARQATWTFAAQRNGAEQFTQQGIAATWLPLACDPEWHARQPVSRQFDWSFVGNVSSEERARLLELLRRHNPAAFVGRRYFTEMAAVYSSSKIVFNRSILDDINMRVFESLCSGSLLLTNDLAENGLEELFQDGVHLATYRSDLELREKLDNFLQNDGQRERIAAAGRAEVLAKHTYRHRMERLLDVSTQQTSRSVAVTDWLDEVDIGIKTFLRPAALRHLLASIREHYPRARVTIADDGGLATANDADSVACRNLLSANPQFRLITLPFDAGVSAGRNALVSATDRPYLLVLDDDFCFTADTRIERLWDRLQADPGVGVAAGICLDVTDRHRQRRRSGGVLERQGATLHHATSGWRDAARQQCDYFPTFALFRRDVFSQAAWRGGVGGEHYDFCLQLQQAGITAIQDETVTIDHDLTANALPGYRERRLNYAAAQQELLERWGLDRVVQDGVVILERTAATRDDSAAKSVDYFEHDRPDIQELVPLTARRILDVGCGAGRMGAALKTRQAAHVTGIELNPRAAAFAKTRLDQVLIANMETDKIDFRDGAFDCVICADILEHLRQPELVLKKIRRWLSPEGALIVSIPNVRNHTVISSLLAGNWTYESAGLLDADHVRFFTRRELEKLLFRSGFDVDELRMVPGEGFSEWVEQGRPLQVSLGGMQIQAKSSADATEFFAYQYLARAVPDQQLHLAHESSPSPVAGLEKLKKAFPWPEQRPDVRIPRQHLGWFEDGARAILSQAVGFETKLIVELGSWLGLSTRFLADHAPQATVIAVDHWQGSPEHQRKPEWQEMLPHLYESFIALSWDYRQRIQPIRLPVEAGLRAIADAGLRPDVIFVDADHSYDAVTKDLIDCHQFFPGAILVGDDYDDPGVQRAVDEFAVEQGWSIQTAGQRWRAWKLVNPAVVPHPASGRPAGLTSIILVTWNQLPFTRLCLDSLRLRTDEPYELIVVDNGSTDGTIDWLRAQADIRLIENDHNCGFPAAVNQGLQIARGENLLLLNNDTVLTTGWLRKMLDVLHSEAGIGLVGPCSNWVGSEQQVPVDYTRLENLDGFAWDLRAQLVEHGKPLTELTDRLVGFCLLFKRDVLDAVGMLDERFGIGCFEDDDFCRRVIAAGYRAVIARDAFIHHFGSVTFQASGADLGQILRDNQRVYDEKWNSEEYRTEAPSRSVKEEVEQQEAKGKPRPAFVVAQDADGNLILEPNTVRLSGCLIVRNNESTIRPCLESLKPWVDELVVVDTGSSDRTPAIAEELGARVFHWPWRDDFAAARNVSLDHARGEWLFWMDSDDVIPPECGRKLRALADSDHSERHLGYVMQVHCPGNEPTDITVVDHVKLFRNRPELRFEFRIHEQILPAIRRAGGEVAFTDISVVHSGSDRTKAGQARKLERDFKLLHLELADRPDHPFVLFNLGMTHADCGQHLEAIRYLECCLAVSNPEESHVRKAYALLISSQMQSGQLAAAETSCHQGRKIYPDDKELLFRQAMLEHQQGKLADAAATYERILSQTEDRHFTSVDTGLATYKARHNLALVYEDLGDLVQAERAWAQITGDEPNYPAGWRGLFEMALQTGQIERAAQLVAAWRDHPCAEVRELVPFAEGRLCEIRGDVDAALSAFARADELRPAETMALRQACRLSFESGHWEQARNSLAQLAKRAPDDASVFHNLGVAHWKSDQPAAARAAWIRSLCIRPGHRETLQLLRSLESIAEHPIDTVATTISESCSLPLWKTLSDESSTKHEKEVVRTTLTIGMATHRDYDGVYFTVNALRLYHANVLPRCEIVIVDNDPDGPQAVDLRNFCANLSARIDGWPAPFATRYIPYREANGTSAPRDHVFNVAHGDAVLVIDSHVNLWPGALQKLLDWYDEHPDCDDLLQGPLVYDSLAEVSTHFADVWRDGMWGTWDTDPRGVDPAAPPFEIPSQGLGLFSCRKRAWLGFNPRFREFGGEEWYIHEKYRLAGRRCLCLPFLRWVHRFSSPASGRVYRYTTMGKVRNYILGLKELGLPLDRLRRHYVEGLNEDPLDPLNHDTHLTEAQFTALVEHADEYPIKFGADGTILPSTSV